MTLLSHKAGTALYLLICIVFTVAFAWLFVAGANWPAIAESTKTLELLYILPALLALVASYFFRLYRWAYLLRQHAPSIHISNCITPYLSAFALNNVLPFRIGDIARITLFGKMLGANRPAITSTLLLERILDFLSLALLLALSSLLLIPNPGSHTILVYIFSVAIAVIIALAGLLLFSRQIMGLSDFAHSHCQQWPLLAQTTGFLRNTVHSIYRHASWHQITTLFLYSAGIWLAEALLFWSVAQGFGVTLSALGSFFVMGLSTFSTLLPSTPGYIGTFHYLCRLAMELIGTNTSTAISFAITTHLIIVLPVTTIGGLGFIRHFGKNTRLAIRNSLAKKFNGEA